MKILLISGHGGSPSDPGACSNYGIEKDETRKVVSEMKNQFKGNNIEVDVYPTDRNAYNDVYNGCVQVNFANYNYIFEVHFNAASSIAHGTEIWVTPDEKSITVEQTIISKLSKCGFTNRGVKKEYFAVINSAKKKGVSAALVEVCFISNESDMNNYRNKFSEVCNAMVSGILEGFGLTASQPVVTTPPQQTQPKPPVITPTPQPIVTPTPQTTETKISYNQQLSVGKTLRIKYASSWSVYPLGKAPVKVNAIGSLNPKTYGNNGILEYTILGLPQANVATIQTSSYGKVNIFLPIGDKEWDVVNKVTVTVPKPQPPVAKPPTPQSSASEYKVNAYNEKGVFTCTESSINFRNNPIISSSNPIIGQYFNGETVTYDYVYITNLYVYISWISGSGIRRYMPVRDKSNGEVWGTFK